MKIRENHLNLPWMGSTKSQFSQGVTGSGPLGLQAMVWPSAGYQARIRIWTCFFFNLTPSPAVLRTTPKGWIRKGENDKPIHGSGQPSILCRWYNFQKKGRLWNPYQPSLRPAKKILISVFFSLGIPPGWLAMMGRTLWDGYLGADVWGWIWYVPGTLNNQV